MDGFKRMHFKNMQRRYAEGYSQTVALNHVELDQPGGTVTVVNSVGQTRQHGLPQEVLERISRHPSGELAEVTFIRESSWCRLMTPERYAEEAIIAAAGEMAGLPICEGAERKRIASGTMAWMETRRHGR